ncbi:Sel1 domain protein repeat-containing protein [Methylophaga frappieri]|uniref:Sel1 domain protein repeat-containing protein n=2 Tax=Methylophaga frappieri (strain ATCC BAA-2434 / DSM 25690 / JAM7) TaxID=754477 RepID=I1YIJ3_METFJ|nr:Sel1 domain protein repeat-containing protein [Methylophaga frappieri]
MLTGCTFFQQQTTSTQSAVTLEPGPDANQETNTQITEPERDAFSDLKDAQTVRDLFAQDYIDPLTQYLKTHADQTNLSASIKLVKAERDRRCQVIAKEYDNRPVTAESVARYQSGYQFSCPAEVSAYAARLEPTDQDSTVANESESLSSENNATTSSTPSAELEKCYLLTSIKNYSAAIKTCEPLAAAGDTAAQYQMAKILNALYRYDEAISWAEKAAPASADSSFLLATLYARGQGTSQDLNKANYWYQKAAESGHPEAIKLLEKKATTEVIP